MMRALSLFFAIGVAAPVHAAQITWSTDELEVITQPTPLAKNNAWIESYVRNTRGAYTFRIATHDVDGATSRSFRSEGHVYDQRLSLSNRATLSGGRLFEWRLELRHAEDPQLTARRDVTLENLLVTYARPDRYELKFGNVYGNFSRYSFQRSLEGLTGFWNGKNHRLSIISGRTARDIDGRSLQRYANGIRSLWSLGSGRTIGLNFAAAHDDPSSATGNLAALDGRVYSIDWLLPLKWWSAALEGEVARTDVTPNRRASGNARVGTAWRSSLRANPIKAWHVNANIERVDPDAQNPLASIAADQFRWDVSANGALPWEARAGLNFYRSENNVENQLPATSVSHVAGANLSVPILRRVFKDSTGMEALWDARFTIAARAADRKNSTRTFDNSTYDQNYSVSNTFAGIRASLGYNYQISIDRLTRNNDRRVKSWNMALSRDVAVRRLALVLSPTVSYSSSRDYTDRIRATNRNHSIATSVGFRFREKLTGALGYSFSDRDNAARTNDAVQNTFTANANYQLDWHFPTQLALSMRFNRVDDEEASQDYLEREGQLSVSTTF